MGKSEINHHIGTNLGLASALQNVGFKKERRCAKMNERDPEAGTVKP